ncbi:ATPase involved in DNA repair [Achromobacter xylosoxidans]|uniref:AAA family ATPase n=1 Tax=Alcaligenes xylosoxydans xylosoxydans TaxID=85698 RepID=UPI0012A943C1|nr:AAA family ATPase [Achromobacter xylosoxidans]CUR76704.1 ATPase involved in DNA repair [Achromobacter xylosoxidans]
MFLKKITTIKNVGRFKAARISGGEYGRFTLIYGGNGRGKTTLCAILRSLQSNEPTLIKRRKTFLATSEPEVGLLFDGGSARFSGGAWTAAQRDIHIFDQQFITENVHGGDQIDIEHRRNFYRIVVGPTGVALAGEVDRLDADATAKQSEITSEKKVLEQHVPAGMTLEAFLKLAEDADIDDKIDRAEKALKAINDGAAIASRKLLSVPSLPAPPVGFIDLLAKGVDGIAADAATRVQRQLAHHDFRDGGEGWLSQGLPHIVNDYCPFCASPLDGNNLIEAYRGYFSEAYVAHKAAIADMSTTLDHALSSATAFRVEQGFAQVSSDAEFWMAYVDHGYKPSGAADRISGEVEALFDAAKAMLAAKAAAPLETVRSSTAFIQAQATWLATRAELDADVAMFAEANLRIQAVKDANAIANKATAEKALAVLQAVKKRHSAPVHGLASNYSSLLKDKKALVAAKDAKKDELDSYDERILSAYETDINQFLASFGASFRLAQCRKNYVGKAPQSVYCLRFDTSDIDVTKSNVDDPGFDTTMSAGDKNTFALAFFLSQLKRDPDIASKIVVFDDPFTSLDDFRRAMTAKEIARTGEPGKAAQVILLSHDKFFLDAVRGMIHGATCTPLQISASASGSSIEPWDIEREVKEGYLQDHMRLQDFAEGRSGDARDIRMMMRPLLEKYIRYRFPNQILEGKWLGDMLAIIREDTAHPLAPQYSELDDINGYTAPFHHDPNTPFVEDEVRTYARRTIAIVGGC